MVLLVIILVFTSIRSLQSWDIVEQDKYDVLESWGIKRTKRTWRIKTKFPEHPQLSCDMLYKTKETPFVAIILYRSSGRLLCMGSIVDHHHILTSKRCYESVDVVDLRVLVGYYKAWWGRYAQIKHVRKILRHEFAVALLRLKDPLKFTQFVQAVRLPSSSTKKELDVSKVFPPPYQVAGFFVDRYDVPGDYMDKEKTYKLKEDSFTSFDLCKKNYSKLLLDQRKLFCVFGNATYCWGGWGSPVLKPSGTNFLQIGVVVHDNCTSDTTGPFLVARTDVYGEWIDGNTYQGHVPN